MSGFYNGPHGECSEQMYKLYQLLKAKGITLYNGFLPEGSFFFAIGNDRYTVWDEPDGNGLHMDIVDRLLAGDVDGAEAALREDICSFEKLIFML